MFSMRWTARSPRHVDVSHRQCYFQNRIKEALEQVLGETVELLDFNLTVTGRSLVRRDMSDWDEVTTITGSFGRQAVQSFSGTIYTRTAVASRWSIHVDHEAPHNFVVPHRGSFDVRWDSRGVCTAQKQEEAAAA